MPLRQHMLLEVGEFYIWWWVAGLHQRITWCEDLLSQLTKALMKEKTITGHSQSDLDCSVQMIYMQSPTNRSEIIRQKKEEIEQSKSFEKLPENLQKQIKRYQSEKWEESDEFGNLFNNDDLRRNIKRQLCVELLLKVSKAHKTNHSLNQRNSPRIPRVRERNIYVIDFKGKQLYSNKSF
ncbi:hypothetical protein Ddye_027497 [Dipteronia dyeriana]|uniref:Uncharacterized protein n=1 Tax=Dipteronia dyeriana TaxID=168575 RepID=A0AAD9TPN1_9ROSI|nr:hypothetical protein Ddye_027497 [Dipteronia dyeriana]